MAQTIVRTTLTQFGSSGASSYFGQFGSKQAGSPVTTKVIATIQALSAWVNGWQAAVYSSNNAPFLEDMNSIHFLENSYLCYLLQEGTPEYDSGTTYNVGSVVKAAYGSASAGVNYFYISIVDGNTGNALPTGAASNAYWQLIYGVNNGGLIFAGTNTNDAAAAGIVGEYHEIGPTGQTLTDNTWIDIVTLSLTAGDWDIRTTNTQYKNTASGPLYLDVAVSTTSGTSGAGLTIGKDQVEIVPDGIGTGIAIPLPTLRFSFATTTSIYLKMRGHYTSGASTGIGFMSARRMR